MTAKSYVSVDCIQPVDPPPAGSRLRYEVAPEGVTVRSVPPPPLAAAVMCGVLVFMPVVAWVIAYTERNKPPFSTFLGLMMVAIALTTLAIACLGAFLRRLVGPPLWRVTAGELLARRPGAVFPRRFRFGRSEIVTVRSGGGSLQVVTQRAGQWRAESFPVLTTGGAWLAELIATRLGVAALPHRYVMVRTPPGDGSAEGITYGIEGAGPREATVTTGVRAVAPEGDPPAGAGVRIGRGGDAWSVTRPVAGWAERVVTWVLLGGAAVLMFCWIVSSAAGLGIALLLVCFGVGVGRPIVERFARTCGPTVLTYADDTLHLGRPTGWGTCRQTLHWWMIGSVGIHPVVRRGRPRADVRVQTRTGGVVPLFVALPERDARWVAALVAGTFGMEEGEASWGLPEERTMGPR